MSLRSHSVLLAESFSFCLQMSSLPVDAPGRRYTTTNVRRNSTTQHRGTATSTQNGQTVRHEPSAYVPAPPQASTLVTLPKVVLSRGTLLLDVSMLLYSPTSETVMSAVQLQPQFKQDTQLVNGNNN